MTFPDTGKFRGIAIISYKVRLKQALFLLFYQLFLYFPLTISYSLLSVRIMQFHVKSRNSFRASLYGRIDCNIQ
jgi:hypothetical protein